MSLHGTRSTAEGQARLPGFQQLAQTASAVVVFPQAIEPIGTGYEWDPTQDVDYLGGLATELLSRDRTQHGRVLLMGMSGGARMSGLFATVHPDLVQPVGAVAGLRAPGGPVHRSVTILAFHGTKDGLNPYGQRHETLERKRPRRRPGMGAGQRHHVSTGGSRRERRSPGRSTVRRGSQAR